MEKLYIVRYQTRNPYEYFDYRYGSVYGGIGEYYLIKEGYIPCEDYRENKNDPYYIVCSRQEFCMTIDTVKPGQIFKNLDSAKKFMIDNLKEFCEKEKKQLVSAVGTKRKQILDM